MDDSVNLFVLAESVIDETPSDAPAQGAECKRECPLKFASTKGALCILSADGSGSILISLFGVPLQPPMAVEQPVVTVAETTAQPEEIYFSPTLAVHSPPPKA